MGLVNEHWPRTALPAPIWVAAVELLTACGELEEARAFFQHAPSVEPSEVKLLEARIALRDGREAEARELVRTAIAQLAPENVLLGHELGRLALGLSEYAPAVEALEKITASTISE
jgi:tetratricopeptide (TPR) repeat protein